MKDEPETANENDELKNKEIIVTFPEKEIRISKKEFSVFSPFHENEKVMRLLTGQLSFADAASCSNGTAPSQQDQADMIAKLIQNNPNMNNLNGLAGMQNLMNNQLLQGMGGNQPNAAATPANNMMASMMNMNSLGQNPLSTMSSNLQNSTQNPSMNPQNMQNDQLISNLMNNNMPWNVPQMNGAATGNNGNFGNLDNKSLSDLINSQMMNFNTSFMGIQDTNQPNNNNMGMNNQQPNSFPQNPPK